MSDNRFECFDCGGDHVGPCGARTFASFRQFQEKDEQIQMLEDEVWRLREALSLYKAALKLHKEAYE